MGLYSPTQTILMGEDGGGNGGGGGDSKSNYGTESACVGTGRNISHSVVVLRACLTQIYIVKSWCRTCMRSLSSKRETVKLLSV